MASKAHDVMDYHKIVPDIECSTNNVRVEEKKYLCVIQLDRLDKTVCVSTEDASMCFTTMMPLPAP